MLILQTPPISEATGILSIEKITVLGILTAIIIYLIWQTWQLKKELKDERQKIGQLVDEHKQDLKEDKKDTVEMVNRYHSLVLQLSAVNNGRQRQK
ncbi:hypothetical protein RM553_12655 [Zunongwangia sp. F363]|uniref:Uncharacterized protein n=1 Tax=Autumnicola tepida TaxID=3075595 RepID=A0ABU3CBH7_9FLAO|nr:hypothetical protein [Zunongwangia sp. F363]MDT0643685.1 hypothetical protein [Zunongwangia sp. F363]